MNAWERTCAAVAEAGQPRVVDALRATGPNGAGLPLIGILGWMPPGHRLVLCRARDLALRSLGLEERDGPEAIAEWIWFHGAWRNPSVEKLVLERGRSLIAWTFGADAALRTGPGQLGPFREDIWRFIADARYPSVFTPGGRLG